MNVVVRGCPKKTSAVRRGCPGRKFFGQGGFLKCGRPLEFFESYGVSTKLWLQMQLWQRKEGSWASTDIFRRRGDGGQFFAILCGCLLWMAP